MSENQNTDPNVPAGTGGDTPPATPPQGAGSANGDIPEGYELIRTEDKNNLVSARDRANQAASDAEGQNDFVLTLAKEREIGSFLKDNAKDYPDVKTEDLMFVESPEEIEEAAKKLQTTINNAVAKKLQGVEIADQPPKLTDAEKSEKVEALRNSGKTGAFSEMVDLRLQQR